MCEHFYGKVWKNRYLSVHQREQNNMLLIHRWFIFHLERNRGGAAIILRKPKRKTPPPPPPPTNFDFKYSKIEIEFLDTKIYKDTNGKLCLTIYHKPTDWQNYLNFKSSHPPSNHQKSIPYSEAFRISNICTENWWIEAVLKHRYQKTSIDDQFNQLNHQKQ